MIGTNMTAFSEGDTVKIVGDGLRRNGHIVEIIKVTKDGKYKVDLSKALYEESELQLVKRKGT